MESPERLLIKGRVKTGFGRGKGFLAEKRYREQFIHRLGIDPVKGSLNIYTEEVDKLDRLKELEGITIEGFVEDDVDFGDVKAFPAEVNGLKSAVVIPRRTTHENILEVISEHHLRSVLNLKDEDDLMVVVYTR